jgi:hypothetical protein
MPPEAPIVLPEPSAALLQAQARLLQLRAHHGIEGQARPQPFVSAAGRAETVNWARQNAETELNRRRKQAGIAVSACHSAPTVSCQPDNGISKKLVATATNSDNALTPTIVIHPSMGLAILKQHREAPARLYYLLRVIDRSGRGWLPIEQIRQQLTRKGEPLRICGWRRLRQLLREGEGFFWNRDKDRLWLNGAHKIAFRLGVNRLQGYPVDLPVEAFLGGIQAVRAAFYAAFHGGREAKPISRETLRDLSGIPSRTQLEYDRIAHVRRTRNFAIGEHYATETSQERAWRNGRGVFHFVDTKGRQGRAGGEYVAWSLPNSYQAEYQRRSIGNRKRLNRKLADLLQKGTTGNDERVFEKLFFSNGALAVRRYNRYAETDAYWQRSEKTRVGDELWCVFSGIKR